MVEREIISYLPELTTILSSLAFTLAFSLKTRKEIGKRDHWTCVDCGVQFKDGYMVHASHYNHDKSLIIYDSVENGRIQCVDCHQAWHEEHVGNEEAIGMTALGNLAAIELLESTNRGTNNGNG